MTLIAQNYLHPNFSQSSYKYKYSITHEKLNFNHLTPKMILYMTTNTEMIISCPGTSKS